MTCFPLYLPEREQREKEATVLAAEKRIQDMLCVVENDQIFDATFQDVAWFRTRFTRLVRECCRYSFWWCKPIIECNWGLFAAEMWKIQQEEIKLQANPQVFALGHQNATTFSLYWNWRVFFQRNFHAIKLSKERAVLEMVSGTLHYVVLHYETRKLLGV